MDKNYADTGVVVEHIKEVIKEKTIQLTDHLINKVTLENKIKSFNDFPEDVKKHYEGILKSLVGKNQTQHQKLISKLESTEKINLTNYINHKNDLDSLAFANKGIGEHEEFLRNLVDLKNQIEKEDSTTTTSASGIKLNL